MSTGVGRVKQSPFNTVAVDTREMMNTTKNLSEALAKAPGLKLRESGGVGSDMSLADGLLPMDKTPHAQRQAQF